MKRRALQMMVLLILGAIVNVAVAWGLSYFGRALELRRGPFLREFDVPEFAQDLKRVDLSGIKGASAALVIRKEKRPEIWKSQTFGVTKTSGMQFLNGGIHWHDQLAFGLPWYALQTQRDWVYHSGKYAYRILDGISFHEEKVSDIDDLVALPIRPIPLGFAMNTIFYAAILWAVFFGSGMLRRMIRRRRGLCPACAYPIGSAPVCTECGKKIA